MKVDKELILNIAKNAKLELNEDEVKEFVPQFKEILEAFSKLDEINTSKIKPSVQPIELKNVLREDKPEKCLSQEEALKNAQHKKDGYFVGPKAL